MIKIVTTEADSPVDVPGIKIVLSPGWIDRFATIRTSGSVDSSTMAHPIKINTSQPSGALSQSTSGFKIGHRLPIFFPIVDPPEKSFFSHKIAYSTLEEDFSGDSYIVSTPISLGVNVTLRTSGSLVVHTEVRKLKPNYVEIAIANKRRVVIPERDEKKTAVINGGKRGIADSVMPSIWVN